ncbi:hypothetical protein PLEOSDRAFT_1086852 [Pleurotus ostreatus PC15]|uniref:Uncharacterized protein n=1 Tax=Pleurotus ostreatus (strain PC15) TaxID=1137138 RepID=A0A067N2J6_PLEO1|nr:hypothetical protein PLEOSDRAFT_1086852 [Pleurotus ostreatus PC15]
MSPAASIATSTLLATIISITYGLDVEHDPNIERAEKALVQLREAAITGNFLVDVLPFLNYTPSWFPGARFKAYAERVGPDDKVLTFYSISKFRHLAVLVISQREGKGQPSVLSRSLQRGGHSIDNLPDEEGIKDVTWIAYAAMLLYPQMQKKGQEELDTPRNTTSYL